MTQRFAAVDALRGFIMILMAIDHASAFIARQHSSEFYSGAMSIYGPHAAFPFVTSFGDASLRSRILLPDGRRNLLVRGIAPCRRLE